jgi:hypothetical protein
MLAIENLFLWPLLIYPTYYAVEAIAKPTQEGSFSVSRGVKTNILRYKDDFSEVNLRSMQVSYSGFIWEKSMLPS